MGIRTMGRPRRDIPSESRREGNVTLNCLVWLWDFGIAYASESLFFAGERS